MIADVQVSRSATTIKPKIVVNMLNRAKRPVLITGGGLLNDERLVEFVYELQKRAGLEVIATGGSSRALIERDVNVRMAVFTLHYVTQFLTDLQEYDLSLFLGFRAPYYLSRMLSALKHFSNINTISICEWYQPHAKFSFPDFRKKEEYYKALEEILEVL